MIVDTSAVMSILWREPGHEQLLRMLARDASPGIGAPTLVETGIVVTARLGQTGRTVLSGFLEESRLDVIDFGADHWRTAVEAFRRYGKGRHPAGLNLGDCFSYATSRVADEPLLAIGDDFRRTDLVLAL